MKSLRWLILLAAVGVGAPQTQETGIDPSRTLQASNLRPALREQVAEALRRKDLTRAETLLVEEHEREPNAEALRLLGSLFFLDGKYPNAIVALKKAEKLAPLDEPSRFTLAMAYVVIKRVEWARPELNRLAAEFPRNPLYPYWQARLLYDDQKFALAVEKLRKALELDPGYMKAYDKLGLCLEALGDLEEAVATYKKAVDMNRQRTPHWVWPPLNLGALLQKMNRLEEAEEYLREAVSYEPKNAQAHYQLGVALEKREKREEAIAELKQASELDPAYEDPLYALGRIYRNMGDTASAVAALKRFQEIKRGKGR